MVAYLPEEKVNLCLTMNTNGVAVPKLICCDFFHGESQCLIFIVSRKSVHEFGFAINVE
jgi:hypothetical protein